MSVEVELQKKLDRLERWGARCLRLFDASLREAEEQYIAVLQEMERTKAHDEARRAESEQRLKEELESRAKDFSKNKYALEKAADGERRALADAKRQIAQAQESAAEELRRLQDEAVAARVTVERQKSALSDLYQEKRIQLLASRERVIRERETVAKKRKAEADRFERETAHARTEHEKRVLEAQSQQDARRHGWDTALTALQREVDALTREKEDLLQKLSVLRDEKGREIQEARLGLSVAVEQLKVDKATLIEQAEEEERRMREDVEALRAQVIDEERGYQDATVSREDEKQRLEEAFQTEEDAIKRAAAEEAAKRDYDQKLLQQMKTEREKELARVREDDEGRRWHWESQARALSIKKSVQDAEHEAERMRVDRDARVSVRTLESKRDELRQRLAEMRARKEGFEKQAGQEKDVLAQRWRWRKERLWSMWQKRLEALQKERAALHEQLADIETRFNREREDLRRRADEDEKAAGDLKADIAMGAERFAQVKRNREMQFELEKTRVMAQIKELENQISDWVDRQKVLHEELVSQQKGLAEQLGFLDRFYREQDREMDIVLHELHKAMTQLQAAEMTIDSGPQNPKER